MDRPETAPTGKRWPTENDADWLRPQRLLIFGLMVLAVLGFFQAWAARVDRAMLAAETELVEVQLTLKATLTAATAQLDLLRVHAEQGLINADRRQPRPLDAWLQLSPGGDAFIGMPPGANAAMGYVSVGAPMPEMGDERAREAQVVAGLTPMFSSVKKYLGSVTWVYYLSLNRVMAAYPYDKGSHPWSDRLLYTDIFLNAAALNPGGGFYWSDVYADSAGKRLMCSTVNPVYDGESRFRAIVGFDFAVDSLTEYLQKEDLAIGTPLIVNRKGHLLAHPTLYNPTDKGVRSLTEVLPPELRPESGRLLEMPPGSYTIDSWQVTALDLGVAPWRLLLVVDKQRLAFKALGDMHVELAVFALLLLALLFLLRIDRLTAALRKLRTAVESSDVAVIMTDSHGVIEFVNKGFCAHTGYSAEEALGHTTQLLQSGETPAETYRELWQTVLAGRSWHGDLLNRRKDGSTYWAATDISPIMNSKGKLTNFVAAQLDVTEKRRLEEELARLAVTDSLSGLANRRRFMAVLEEEAARTRRSGEPFALLMFDIDHFKHVNDRYGHSMGDRAIVALANELVAATREIDTVGRLGGEEFGVILPASGLSDALTVAERIRRAVESMEVTAGDGKIIRMTISAGAAVQEGDISAEELLRRADSALYTSKKAGRNRVTPFRAE